MKYNFAYFLVWFHRLFCKKGTYKHYELTFLLEDINEEKGAEFTTNLMKKNKACTPWMQQP